MSSIDDKYFESAKDYGRKSYRTADDMSFQDYMKKKTFFMFDGQYKAPFSEFEKPYFEDDYTEMEQFLHNPPGLWDFPDYPPWSWPDNPQVPPGQSDLPPGGDGFIVFNCDIDGCWCPSDTRTAVVICTHQITGIALSQGGFYAGDFSIAAETGGTRARLSITADKDAEGAVEVDVFMKAGSVPGSHGSIMITECSDCELCDQTDDVSWDSENSAATVNPGDDAIVKIKDGVPPFVWTITRCGDDLGNCSLSSSITTGRSNVINVDAAACGMITISVTDSCEDEATGEVKITEGTYQPCDSHNEVQAGGCGCSCGGVYTSMGWSTTCTGGGMIDWLCGYYGEAIRIGSVCGAACCDLGCGHDSCIIGPKTCYGITIPCFNGPCGGAAANICVQDRIYGQVWACA